MNCLKLRFAFTLLALFLSQTGSAEVLRWPQVCSKGDLEITNTLNIEVRAWIQTFNPDLISEDEIVLKPNEIIKLNLKQLSSLTRFALLHFNSNASVKALFNCDEKKFAAHSFEGGVLTYQKSDLSENKLWIQNIYDGDNKIQIELLDRQKNVVFSENILMKSFEQLNYKNTLFQGSWSALRISADNRFTSFNLTSQGSTGPLLIETQRSEVQAEAFYFVVGPRESVSRTNNENGRESFIVKITDITLVQRARELIANPQLEKMLFAKIQKGHQGFNRNWSKKDKSFWSWSVTEVTNFADLGSTACNGAPQIVEDRINSWVNDPGRICFWNYRVKKELSAFEVARGH